MKKKILLTIGSIIVILFAAGAGYVWWMYHSVASTAGDMYETSAGKGNHKAVTNKKPISLLLLGVDERQGDHGRSDTMIATTLNPKTKTMQMISIPRDTRTEIVGRGTSDKINAAYAYGGTKMAESTAEKFLGDIPFDFYIKINMEGMRDLVDAVGGVTVNNKLDWYDEGYYKKGYHYAKGQINLDTGAKAMGYVRMRHLDPQGDFGRNERQREVIMAIVNKMANVSSVTRYSQILDALGDNVKTNLAFDDMKNLAFNYRDARKNMINYEVKGKGQMINGVYYLVVDSAEQQRVHDMINEQLGNN
ncbi:LCP family glycopolymer transferase [Sporolactobacillus inulinus]|uniref:Transcriptional regulator LytR n=1 Tax=Sporolactobacillus inulinus CASD TaxID=1069536 RepID=A0A0U1QQJ0_9BACL|nr:LCP family protein [Sporolactobacillus inulinus]KLI03075.1 transcriptional regulator LytR [Sporolactobacillus inulinus CASD]GEB78364.1 transcriptional regulator LytR [Sporolactobacillus inulinus]